MKLLAESAMQDYTVAAQKLVREKGGAVLREKLNRLALGNMEGQFPPGTDLSPFALPVVMPILHASVETELHALARNYVRILHRLVQDQFEGGVKGLAVRLGWTDDMMRTLEAGPFSDGLALDIGRPDILIHNENPYFLELNLDCAVGGKMKATRTAKGFLELPHMRKGRPLSVREPLEALRSLIVAANRRCVPVRVALLDYGSEVFLRTIESEILNRAPLALRFVPVDRGNLNFDDFDVVIKCNEIAPELADLEAQTREAFLQLFSTPKKTVLSNGTSTLLSNKLVSPIMAEAAEQDPEAKEFFSRHVPWTRLLKMGQVQFHGERVELAELMEPSHRARFLLKTGFGFAGNGVIWGGDCTEAQWSDTVREGLRKDDVLVQEYLEPDRYDLPYLTTDDRIEMQSVISLFGPYLFGPKPCGTLLTVNRAAHLGMVGPKYRSIALPTFTLEDV